MAAAVEKSSSLKCRKCRLLLVEEPASRLVASVEASSGGEGANVYCLFEDQLPQWISDAIEEVRSQEEAAGWSPSETKAEIM